MDWQTLLRRQPTISTMMIPTAKIRSKRNWWDCCMPCPIWNFQSLLPTRLPLCLKWFWEVHKHHHNERKSASVLWGYMIYGFTNVNAKARRVSFCWHARCRSIITLLLKSRKSQERFLKVKNVIIQTMCIHEHGFLIAKLNNRLSIDWTAAFG